MVPRNVVGFRLYRNESALEPEDAARVNADYLFEAAVQDFVEALGAEADGKKAGYIANCRVVAGNGARSRQQAKKIKRRKLQNPLLQAVHEESLEMIRTIMSRPGQDDR